MGMRRSLWVSEVAAGFHVTSALRNGILLTWTEALLHKDRMMNALTYGMLAAGLMACGWCFGEQEAPAAPPLPVEPVCRIPANGDALRNVIFSPDGSKLVAGGMERASLWEVATGRKIADMRLIPPGEQPSGWVFVSFSGDGSRILAHVWAKDAGGSFYTVWDAATGKPLGETRRLECSSRRARLGPDGRFLIGGTPGNTWWVRDVSADGIAAQARFTVQAEDNMVFSPDGRMVAFFHQFGHVAVCDLVEGKKLWELPRNERDYSVITARFSDDGSSLFVTSGQGGAGAVYDARNGGIMKQLDIPGGQESGGNMFDMMNSPFLMSFDGNKKEMKSLNIPLEQLREEFRECIGRHAGDAQQVAARRNNQPLYGSVTFVAQNGRYAVMMERSGCQMYNYESPVVIWDVQKRQLVGKPLYWKPFIMHAFLSPGERFLCIAPGNGSPAGLVPLSSGVPVSVPGPVMAFARGDFMIACCEEGAVSVWRVKDEKAAAVQAPAQAAGKTSK